MSRHSNRLETKKIHACFVDSGIRLYLAVSLGDDSVPPAVSYTCRYGEAGDVPGSEREREADAAVYQLQRDELIRVSGARLVVQQQRVLLQRRKLHIYNEC